MNTQQQVLMEIGVDNPVPVSDALYIVDGTWLETFAALYNLKPLGITHAECCELLWELYEWGFIAFYNYQRYPFRKLYAALALDRTALYEALAIPFEAKRATIPERIYYRLTPRGGAAWAQQANADWNCFLWFEEGMPSESELRPHVRIKALSRDAAEAFYRCDAEMLKIIVPDSRRDQVLRIWQPTYWKRFSQGYQIDYDLLSDTEIQDIYPGGATSLRRFTPRWYDTPEY